MQKRKHFLAVGCLLFALGMIGVLCFMNGIHKLNEKNTVEYKGTFSKIEATDTGKNIYIMIYADEYTNALLVSADEEFFDSNRIYELEKGEGIIFRIEDYKKDLLNQEKVAFVNIVELRTETEAIFTLYDYNQYISADAKNARIAGVVVTAILLSVSAYCVVSSRRKREG